MDKNIDPAEKVLLLQLIEEDGKKLTVNLEKQKNIDEKFKYDPSKHVSDLLSKIKEAIERKDNNSTSRNPKASKNPTDPNNSDSEDDISSEEARNVPNNNNQDDHQPTN
ncbi:12604_t:CDS:1 [Funneliformis geosporum]|nr:12604_t:CDS:1 [Funneliformis geosporum]